MPFFTVLKKSLPGDLNPFAISEQSFPLPLLPNKLKIPGNGPDELYQITKGFVLNALSTSCSYPFLNFSSYKQEYPTVDPFHYNNLEEHLKALVGFLFLSKFEILRVGPAVCTVMVDINGYIPYQMHLTLEVRIDL
jgi:hypothetical protein